MKMGFSLPMSEGIICLVDLYLYRWPPIAVPLQDMVYCYFVVGLALGKNKCSWGLYNVCVWVYLHFDPLQT